MADTDIPAADEARADITITHTREAGTLAEGTAKGDGSAAPLKAAGFRWSRTLGSWYLPHSRDKAAKRWNIRRAEAGLTAAGFAVAVDIDDTTPGRTFAEAEADRMERAEDRADRYGERSARHGAAADARQARASERLEHIPMGQPILVGHHSEKAHRRVLERHHADMRAAVEGHKSAEYWAGRAEAADNWAKHRTSIPTTLRRIQKLEAERRTIERALPKAEGDHAARLAADLAYNGEQLDYWRGVVAEAEERGVKVWSRADFTRGDYVRGRWAWFEVIRVNAKTLTIPHIHNSGKFVAAATSDGYTWPLPYDEVRGRMSAEEVAEAKAEAEAASE
jgi:hypothetical protein